jgi:hypothetical protein
MTDWAVLIEDVAPILAAVSALLIYGADRLVSLWNWFTARDRVLASLQRLDPSINTLLSELRAGNPKSKWSNLVLLQYTAPSLILLLTERLPGGMALELELLGVASYLVAISIISINQARDVVPKLLVDSADQAAWAGVQLRYGLLRNFRLALFPAATGAVTAALATPAVFLNQPLLSTLTAVGFLGYGFYIFLRASSAALNSIEGLSYSARVKGRGAAPVCKITLARRHKSEASEVTGSLQGIGEVLAVLREDGFVEEVDWPRVSSIAVRPPPVPSK